MPKKDKETKDNKASTSATPKKTELKDFIKENEYLVTALGVIGALAALFTAVPNGIYPAIISFGLLLVISVELIKCLFASGQSASETMWLFKILTLIFPWAVFAYITQAYWSFNIFRGWFLPFIGLEAISLTIPMVRKRLTKKFTLMFAIVLVVTFELIYYLLLPHFPARSPFEYNSTVTVTP